MKSLPGTGVDVLPARLVRIARRQQQQQLRLQRIGVLELVHEDPLEPLLEVPPHRRVVAHEVARAQQQVEEVERALARLSASYSIDASEQLGVQQRRQVGVGAHLELVERQHERVARLQHLRAGHALRVGRAACPCARA